MTPEQNDRRPISMRGSGISHQITQGLVKAGIRPNWISLASLGFAVVALMGFWMAGASASLTSGLGLLLAILGIQGRLLCNLFDGMVAVEGGVNSPAGPFWNEFPDRVADVMILYGFGWFVGRPDLGLWAAIGALTIAYVRELGARLTGHADFSGPMAKPHRMMWITAFCLIGIIGLMLFPGTNQLLMEMGLWGLIIGCCITLILRSWRLIRQL